MGGEVSTKIGRLARLTTSNFTRADQKRSTGVREEEVGGVNTDQCENRPERRARKDADQFNRDGWDPSHVSLRTQGRWQKGIIPPKAGVQK